MNVTGTCKLLAGNCTTYSEWKAAEGGLSRVIVKRLEALCKCMCHPVYYHVNDVKKIAGDTGSSCYMGKKNEENYKLI